MLCRVVTVLCVPCLRVVNACRAYVSYMRTVPAWRNCVPCLDAVAEAATDDEADTACHLLEWHMSPHLDHTHPHDICTIQPHSTLPCDLLATHLHSTQPNLHNSPAPQPHGSHALQPHGSHSSQPHGSHASQPHGSHASQPHGSHASQPHGSHASHPHGSNASLPANSPLLQSPSTSLQCPVLPPSTSLQCPVLHCSVGPASAVPSSTPTSAKYRFQYTDSVSRFDASVGGCSGRYSCDPYLGD